MIGLVLMIIEAGAGVAADTSATLDPSGQLQLTAQTIPVPETASGAPEATLLGPLPGSTPLLIDVGIDEQLQKKQAAVSAIYDSASSSYHHFYTDATWDAQFSVPQVTYDAVANQLVADGMQVAYSDQER
ncbi:MAG TPA: protease pro-enzyme activation domain-containing protein, partial [Acidimicrobiales bacterium]|nr:protease pro-enzyme activation domain-containing protein [Acidimicrobiales bacterium]